MRTCRGGERRWYPKFLPAFVRAQASPVALLTMVLWCACRCALFLAVLLNYAAAQVNLNTSLIIPDRSYTSKLCAGVVTYEFVLPQVHAALPLRRLRHAKIQRYMLMLVRDLFAHVGCMVPTGDDRCYACATSFRCSS
jgi:hypothetical protein